MKNITIKILSISIAFFMSTHAFAQNAYSNCYFCNPKMQIPDKISNVPLFKFYSNDIKSTESLYKYNQNVKYDYLGVYQMGKAALIEAGFVADDGNLSNASYYQWTPIAKRYGVTDKKSFLMNKKAQDIAFAAYTDKQLVYVKKAKGLDFLCKEVTKDSRVGAIDIWGMLEASYYFGVVDTVKSLKNLAYDKNDAMGMTLHDYALDGSALNNKCIARKNIVHYLGGSSIE